MAVALRMPKPTKTAETSSATLSEFPFRLNALSLVETLRKRFPPPWRIMEVFQAFGIYDKNGNRLLTIQATERPTLRRCGNGIRLQIEEAQHDEQTTQILLEIRKHIVEETVSMNPAF